jgi:hypothetical protein
MFYLVRVTESKEAVGIYFAMSLANLRDMVDELTDPGGCDYRSMPEGGLTFGNRCPAVPLNNDLEDKEAGEDYGALMLSVDGATEELGEEFWGTDDWKALCGRPSRAAALMGADEMTKH